MFIHAQKFVVFLIVSKQRDRRQGGDKQENYRTDTVH